MGQTMRPERSPPPAAPRTVICAPVSGAGSILLHPTLQLVITGYTDSKGTFEYNQRLSVERATSVYKYLILNGIANERMSVTGMSENDNVARNTTKDNRDAPDGRMLNRRVEFKVSVSEEVIIEMVEIEVPDHLKLDE